MIDELFVDTDCISSFMWVGKINIMKELYGGRIIIPDPVYLELSHPKVSRLKKQVDELIQMKDAVKMDINYGSEEHKLYKKLTNYNKGWKLIGKGEASAIALAKVYDGILVSNNYADIYYYIKKFNLKHLDTGHILLEALNKNIINENEGNVIWNNMLTAGIKLPTKTFSTYIQKNCQAELDS